MKCSTPSEPEKAEVALAVEAAADVVAEVDDGGAVAEGEADSA